MEDEEILPQRDMPLMFKDGTYLVMVLPTDDYETSICHPETGELVVVHSG